MDKCCKEKKTVLTLNVKIMDNFYREKILLQLSGINYG